MSIVKRENIQLPLIPPALKNIPGYKITYLAKYFGQLGPNIQTFMGNPSETALHLYCTVQLEMLNPIERWLFYVIIWIKFKNSRHISTAASVQSELHSWLTVCQTFEIAQFIDCLAQFSPSVRALIPLEEDILKKIYVEKVFKEYGFDQLDPKLNEYLLDTVLAHPNTPTAHHLVESGLMPIGYFETIQVSEKLKKLIENANMVCACVLKYKSGNLIMHRNLASNLTAGLSHLSTSSIPVTIRQIFEWSINHLNHLIQNTNEEINLRVQERFQALCDNYSSASKLSDEQKAAVLASDSVTLCNAGAGSGKTSVIAAKIAFLNRVENIPPSEIVCLTYSKAGAQEMNERVHKNFEIEGTARTIHSFAIQLLTKFGISFKTEEDIDSVVGEVFQSALKDQEFVRIVYDYLLQECGALDSLFDINSYDNYKAHLGLYGCKSALRKLSDVTLGKENQSESPYKIVSTLKGEYVRSLEEKFIADFLYLHNIPYQYEAPYHHLKTATYVPDFFLNEHGVYLEHFGLNRQMRVPSFFTAKRPGGDASEEYNRYRKLKIETHKSFGTPLIQTFSYQFQESTIETDLIRGLGEHGISVEPFDAQSIKPEYRDRCLTFIRQSIDAFHKSGRKLEDVAKDCETNPRLVPALNLFLHVYPLFKKVMDDQKIKNFDMLILAATEAVEAAEQNFHSFKSIIIDEFQDTSRAAILLIQQLMKKNVETRLFCVGDDWQSIYGFNGSDVTIMTELNKLFGPCDYLELLTNYRSTSHIVDTAQNFIKKNMMQTQKMAKAFQKSKESDVKIISALEFVSILNDIHSKVGKNLNDSQFLKILFRSRNDYSDWTKWILQQQLKSDWSRLSFDTKHGSKGTESEIIFVLPPARHKFPHSRPVPPLIAHFLPSDNSIEFSEERRLFYVAMTRAKKKLYLVESFESRAQHLFIKELKPVLTEKILNGYQRVSRYNGGNRQGRYTDSHPV